MTEKGGALLILCQLHWKESWSVAISIFNYVLEEAAHFRVQLQTSKYQETFHQDLSYPSMSLSI